MACTTRCRARWTRRVRRAYSPVRRPRAQWSQLAPTATTLMTREGSHGARSAHLGQRARKNRHAPSSRTPYPLRLTTPCAAPRTHPTLGRCWSSRCTRRRHACCSCVRRWSDTHRPRRRRRRRATSKTRAPSSPCSTSPTPSVSSATHAPPPASARGWSDALRPCRHPTPVRAGARTGCHCHLSPYHRHGAGACACAARPPREPRPRTCTRRGAHPLQRAATSPMRRGRDPRAARAEFRRQPHPRGTAATALLFYRTLRPSGVQRREIILFRTPRECCHLTVFPVNSSVIVFVCSCGVVRASDGHGKRRKMRGCGRSRVQNGRASVATTARPLARSTYSRPQTAMHEWLPCYMHSLAHAARKASYESNPVAGSICVCHR
eukprot:m.1502695 g.1502695  ORF g.1502695 m.1502695 type:complete len:379 (+) comp25207_c0_seq49:6330-7466(+)